MDNIITKYDLSMWIHWLVCISSPCLFLLAVFPRVSRSLPLTFCILPNKFFSPTQLRLYHLLFEVNFFSEKKYSITTSVDLDQTEPLKQSDQGLQ